MIKVLVVDDSAFMRKLFTNTINEDPKLEVVDTARNGQKALDKIKKLNPDVITLDVEMPVRNGLETLKEIATMDRPVPVIMVSALDNRNTVMKALDLGAFDFIPKPSGSISLNIDDITDQLLKKLKTAAKNQGKITNRKKSINKDEKQNTIRRQIKQASNTDFTVIGIGCSSGGPRALKTILTSFPEDFPAGIVAVQHMPAGFTTSLANRINREAEIKVKEAEEGDRIKAGLALIAPGDYHLEVDSRGKIALNQEAAQWGVRPSVDYMIKSMARVYKDNMIGVILTGMGHDGAEGMEIMKRNGGYGLVEDESTALVYGMPSATIKKGAYDTILPLPEIPEKIIDLIERGF